jgi:hypothetical protein
MKQLLDCISVGAPILEQQWQAVAMSTGAAQIAQCASQNGCRPVLIRCNQQLNALVSVILDCA